MMILLRGSPCLANPQVKQAYPRGVDTRRSAKLTRKIPQPLAPKSRIVWRGRVAVLATLIGIPGVIRNQRTLQYMHIAITCRFLRCCAAR